MKPERLSIQIFGPLVVRWADGTPLHLPGAKQRALLALLATGPGQARSRSWLQSRLWSEADDPQGRASLRQALSQLRRALGTRADAVIRSDGDVVALREGAVALTGDPGTGDFLEGLDLRAEGFEDWLREMRAAPPVTAVPQAAGEAVLRVRPRIAVLPFLETPGTTEAGALGDALGQELTRALSRSQLIEMVAHLSCRMIDPRRLDAAGVRQRLDVDYMVTGRCARAGRRLVIDADFVETAGGGLIGSERAEIDLADFLAGGEGAIHDLARSLVRAVMSVSVDLGVTRPLPTVSAHALMMSAITLMHHMSSGNFDRALRQLDEVVARAPQHAMPRAWRAQWYLLRVFQDWSDDPRRDRARAADEAAAALDLNPECAFSLAIDGNLKTVLEGDFDAAMQSFDAALRLNASSPLACQLKGNLLTYLGDSAGAVALAERAQRLSPCDPRAAFFDAFSASAYLVDGQFARAVTFAERSIRANPRHVSAHRARVVGLVGMARIEAARSAARELMRCDPGLTVAGYLASHPAASTPIGRGWAEALRRSGVPEA